MDRVIDRASKKGSTGGASSRSGSSGALESMSDSTFFLGALGVFAVGSLASWGRIYALAMASAGVASRLRSGLFTSLMLQEKEFFDEREPGTLVPVLVEVRLGKAMGVSVLESVLEASYAMRAV